MANASSPAACRDAEDLDADTGQEIRTLKGYTDPVTCCAWSGDGKRILSGSAAQTLKIWDTDKARRSSPSRAHQHGDLLCVEWRWQTHPLQQQ